MGPQDTFISLLYRISIGVRQYYPNPLAYPEIQGLQNIVSINTELSQLALQKHLRREILSPLVTILNR